MIELKLISLLHSGLRFFDVYAGLSGRALLHQNNQGRQRLHAHLVGAAPDLLRPHHRVLRLPVGQSERQAGRGAGGERASKAAAAVLRADLLWGRVELPDRGRGSREGQRRLFV